MKKSTTPSDVIVSKVIDHEKSNAYWGYLEIVKLNDKRIKIEIEFSNGTTRATGYVWSEQSSQWNVVYSLDRNSIQSKTEVRKCYPGKADPTRAMFAIDINAIAEIMKQILF